MITLISIPSRKGMRKDNRKAERHWQKAYRARTGPGTSMPDRSGPGH